MLHPPSSEPCTLGSVNSLFSLHCFITDMALIARVLSPAATLLGDHDQVAPFLHSAVNYPLATSYVLGMLLGAGGTQ